MTLSSTGTHNEDNEEQTEEGKPSCEKESPNFSSTRAVEAALTLAIKQQRELDSHLISTENERSEEEEDVTISSEALTCLESQSHMDTLAAVKGPSSDDEVLRQLKREKVQVLLKIITRARTYLNTQRVAKEAASALNLIPFDARRVVKLPVALRECFHCFACRLLLNYVISFADGGLTELGRSALVIWAKVFCSQLLIVLELDPSPAMASMNEVLKWFEAGVGEDYRHQPSGTSATSKVHYPKQKTTFVNTEITTPKPSSPSATSKKSQSSSFVSNRQEQKESHLIDQLTTLDASDLHHEESITHHGTLPLCFHELLNLQPLKTNFLALCQQSMQSELDVLYLNELEQRKNMNQDSDSTPVIQYRSMDQHLSDKKSNPAFDSSHTNRPRTSSGSYSHTSFQHPLSSQSNQNPDKYQDRQYDSNHDHDYRRTNSPSPSPGSPRKLEPQSSKGYTTFLSCPNIDEKYDTVSNLLPLTSMQSIPTRVILPKDKPSIPSLTTPPPAAMIFLRDLFLMYILSNHLDARIFIIFQRIAEAIDFQPDALVMSVQAKLAAQLVEGSMKKDTKETSRTRNLRRLKVAGVAVGLGALTALSAGIAAPAIAAGFGALELAGMSGTAAFLATAGGSATVASIFGAGTAGLTGWKYLRRIGKIKVFQFDKLQPCLGIDSRRPLPHDRCQITTRRLSHVRDDANEYPPHIQLSLSQETSDDSIYYLSMFRDSDHSSDFGGFITPFDTTLSDESSAQFDDDDGIYETTELLTQEQQQLESLQQDHPKNRSIHPIRLNERKGAQNSKQKLQLQHNKLDIPQIHSSSKDHSSASSSPTSSHLNFNIAPVSPPCLSVTICVSGWLRHMSDVWKPWRGLCTSPCDIYALRWEPAILLELGTFMLNILKQRFAVSAANLWLQTTVAGALTVALMWPMALIQYASGLDNSWMACRERASQGGRLLAEAISDVTTVGSRPVSLIGFSMGARMIHKCLLELHRKKNFHRVANVILIGTPASCDKATWQKARQVVSGRLINVYSRADWLLGFLFRYMEWGITVAGLSEVKVEGVENFDVTGIIRSHGQYADSVPNILAYIGYHSVEHQRHISQLHLGQRHRRSTPRTQHHQNRTTPVEGISRDENGGGNNKEQHTTAEGSIEHF